MRHLLRALLCLSIVAGVAVPADAARYEKRPFIWTGTQTYTGSVVFTDATVTGIDASAAIDADSIDGAQLADILGLDTTTLGVKNSATGSVILNFHDYADSADDDMAHATITANCTDATTGAEDCDLSIGVVEGGAAAQTRFAIDADGGVTIGSADNNSVIVTSDGGSLTFDGGVDVTSAGALALGNTTATSVSACNSADCDTISLGTNADADTISVGDSLDTTAITSALWSVTGPGVLTVPHHRHTIAAAATAAAVDLTPALFRASGVFLADTTANTVDFEVDGALDAADVGTVKHFVVTVGGTNAITFTADGAGVTAVTTVQGGAGASCEDVNDMLRVTVLNTDAALVESFCAD